MVEKSANAPVQRYSWEEFDKDWRKIARMIKAFDKQFDGVYGIPRGGLILATCLSNHLKIPLVLQSELVTAHTLVVDDIADTGRTLLPYNGKNFIATLFKHPQSIVEPDVCIRRKNDRWIVFPWET